MFSVNSIIMWLSLNMTKKLIVNLRDIIDYHETSTNCNIIHQTYVSNTSFSAF